MCSWARLSAKLLGAYNRSAESRKGAISRGWGGLGGFLERLVRRKALARAAYLAWRERCHTVTCVWEKTLGPKFHSLDPICSAYCYFVNPWALWELTAWPTE